MCRVLGYIGETIRLSTLMLEPDNSLVNQSFDPEDHYLLQLAGIGLASWRKGSLNEAYPLLYKSIKPPFYDRNLKWLCEKSEANVFLAHIRATQYDASASVNEENCHPFIYSNFGLALAHNGGVSDYRRIKRDILDQCRPEIAEQVVGNTDSELLYALLMSQFEDPTEDLEVAEIIEGIQKLIRIILDLKVKYNIKGQDILKLFLADRNDLCVANVGIGPNRTLEIEGCWEELKQFPVGTPEFTLSRLTSPVWALKGKKFGQKEGSYQMEAVADEEVRSVIIASEPLTENNQNWVKIPFQHLCYFDYNNGNPKLELIPFNI